MQSTYEGEKMSYRFLTTIPRNSRSTISSCCFCMIGKKVCHPSPSNQYHTLNPRSISINSWQDSIRNRQEFTHIVRAALTSILNRMDCKTPYSRQNSPHILRTHPRGFPHSQRLQTRFPERAKRRTPGHTAPRYCGGGCRSKTS